jgi:hypothetical protein
MCSVLVAYDIGLAIDLAACERLLTAMPERAAIRPAPRTPQYVEYRPAPLHITQEIGALTLGAYRSGTSVDGVLYDFGAISLTYHIPLHGPLRGLLALSEVLYDNALPLQDARQRVEQLLAMVQDTVQRPHIAECVEDYVIFHIAACTTPCRVEELYTAEWDASILRKLHTLESIYTKIADWTTNRRMETLEWIIIVLIAFSILLPFLISMPQH